MARLPTVGGDKGNWGDILNEYLEQSHEEDGTLKTDSVGTLQLQANAVTRTAIADAQITSAKIADGAVGTDHVQDGAIGTSQLADDSVTAIKLQGAGNADGIATLDGDAKLPENQLPSRLSESQLLSRIVSAIDKVVILVDEHGLMGDWVGGVAGSGTNDTAALQALVTAAPESATLRFTAGKTYRIDNVLSEKALTIDGAGASIVTNPNAGLGPMLRFAGAASASTHLFNAAAEGDTSIVLATGSQAANYAVGDFVYLSDNKQLVNWAGTPTGHYGRGEIRRVIGIVSGTLRLDGAIEWAYDTSPRVRKITKMLTAPVVRGFSDVREIDPALGATETDTANATGHHLFAFDFCDRPVIEDLSVHGWDMQIANFYRCLAPNPRRIRGISPFRPVVGGCGYIVRFERCHNGLAEQLRGDAVRHMVDQVVSYDSGSRNCIGVNGVNAQFYLHGTLSKRGFSTDDVVNGPSVGWAAGNPSYGPDYGFTITRPVYRGAHYASMLRAGSVGMTIIEPDFASSMDAQTSLAIPYSMVGMFEGASGLTIEGGTIAILGAGFDPHHALRVSTRYESLSVQAGWEPGDITIRRTRFTGARATLSINAAGNVLLEGLVCDTQFTASGIPWVHLSSSVAARTLVLSGLRDTAAASYRKGIQVGNTPTLRYEVQGNVLTQSLNTGNGGFEGPAAAILSLVGNTFKTGESIGLTGDVSTAKTGGAQIARNRPATFDQSGVMDGVSVRGDADATLTAGSSQLTQVWSASLTANRTATLSTTITPQSGNRFRIVRTGAGAFTLTIGATGKTLAQGQWCEVAWVNSAWTIIGYGTL